MAALFGSIACLRTGSFESTRCPSSTRSTARGAFPSTEPSTRVPPAANDANARAISSGLTASTPSPMAK
jgi:hypothetical protein